MTRIRTETHELQGESNRANGIRRGDGICGSNASGAASAHYELSKC